MSGVQSADGLVHAVSDGPSRSRIYALCDIVELDAQRRFSMGARMIPVPNRNWSPNDIEDVVPTCLFCVGIVLEAIRD